MPPLEITDGTSLHFELMAQFLIRVGLLLGHSERRRHLQGQGAFPKDSGEGGLQELIHQGDADRKLLANLY